KKSVHYLLTLSFLKLYSMQLHIKLVLVLAGINLLNWLHDFLRRGDRNLDLSPSLHQSPQTIPPTRKQSD
ncbi:MULTISPECIES: hypothetical protein, partial [unclassified Microcoleus]|uniref:hypothetical protein n=1 Tax=unclassified Microcoleus TaxID=2642155 RepID=UPI002FCE8E31